MKKLLPILTIACGMILGCITASAYSIWYSGGFSPVPAYVSCYNGFSEETLSAVHNGCLAWNGAGSGYLVFRNTELHSNTTFPFQNNKNEITKGYRGYNNYLMATNPVQKNTSQLFEVDIDINVSQPWGSATTSFDTRTSITHELGHLLGLYDVKSGLNNVMYYMRDTHEQVYQLSQDDKNGINSIY